AGAVFVQSLTSAKFDGMPRSAIDSGLADVVAPAEELPARILAYRKHAPQLADDGDGRVEETSKSLIENVIVLIRTHTGNDFSLYKRSTIVRRVERRTGLHLITNPSHYLRLLRENPEEIDLLHTE